MAQDGLRAFGGCMAWDGLRALEDASDGWMDGWHGLRALEDRIGWHGMD